MKWLDDGTEQWEVVLEHLAPGTGDLSTRDRAALESDKARTPLVVSTETVLAKVVVSCAGGLVEPKSPVNVPGIDTFEGEIVHTAQWRSVDVKGKNIVVVGTGCSSAQVVPQLIKPEYGARQVTQLMRSAPWVVNPFPPNMRAFYTKFITPIIKNVPGGQNLFRKLLFFVLELEFLSLFSNGPSAEKRREAYSKEILSYLYRTVPKEYHEIMTPTSKLFCKRRIVDDGWLTALQRPEVEITNQPLLSVEAKSITLGSKEGRTGTIKEQRTIPADVIIMANGFETNEWLHPIDITGRTGQSLYKTWRERGGAQAYLGTAMDGFPNFFIIFGPNTVTGHSSVILASENMVNYSLNFIKDILSGTVSTYEVKESAERRWTAEIQAKLKSFVMGSGCSSWFVDRNGWNSTVYPRSQIDFTLRCMFPRWSDWNVKYTAKGLLSKRRGQLRNLLGGGLFILGCLAISKDTPVKRPVVDVLFKSISAVEGVFSPMW